MLKLWGGVTVTAQGLVRHPNILSVCLSSVCRLSYVCLSVCRLSVVCLSAKELQRIEVSKMLHAWGLIMTLKTFKQIRIPIFQYPYFYRYSDFFDILLPIFRYFLGFFIDNSKDSDIRYFSSFFATFRYILFCLSIFR